jgi:hypothetical protein
MGKKNMAGPKLLLNERLVDGLHIKIHYGLSE